MFSKIFIERPILAVVISILITLIGGIAILTLPIAQYPQIVPPQISINTIYLGADAKTVEENVAQPIEQEVNGSENMIYMTSNNSSTGSMTGTVTYEVGSNQDMALVDVNNRVNIAKAKLPQDVQRFGVTVKKKSSAILVVLSLFSKNPVYDDVFLSNYATINVVDALKRIPGVGDVMIFGARDYGMRIWLDPDKMSRLGVTSSDVINAINEQNKQAPAGQTGLPPTTNPLELQYSVNVKGRLQDTTEFSNIVVRALNDGSFVRMKDVGRVVLEAQDYTQASRLNGGAAANIGVYQLPSANALDVVKQIEEKMKEIGETLPDGVEYSIPYNTTVFVEKSIEEVVHTLFEAILLVLIVVFIFLQNWRATLIPMLAVPVSLVGTFGMFVMLGFSINLLTLFGLVLAIGIVVDDAIVVVEAVSEKMEHGMDSKTASIEAMKEVGGPVIAIALILIAVFVPVAFMGGIAGQLYQQFALTLAGSVAISAVVALTLTPALTALMLKPHKPMGGPIGKFFAWFNRVFERGTTTYVNGVRFLSRKLMLVVLTLLAIMGATYGLFNTVPTGFIPDEDQGACFVYIQLPNAASLGRTGETIRQVEAVVRKDENVKDVISFIGNNIVSGVFGSNTGSLIVTFKPFADRPNNSQSVFEILKRLKVSLAAIPSAVVVPFNLPPIVGLGNAGGFQFELQDRTGGDPAELARVAKEFIAKASQRKELAGLSSSYRADVPQIGLEIDREKVKSLNIPLGDVMTTLQALLGGYYVNDITMFGKTFKVYIQAESDKRAKPEDIDRYHVRTLNGDMVPLSTVTHTVPMNGPSYTFRYNLYRTAEIAGAAAPGFSSGDAITAMEEVAKTDLPPGYGFEWTGTAFQEKKSGSQTIFIFGMAIVAVFLLLAALYESWSIPFAVILAVPLAVFGAMVGQFARGLENNIYAQIGLVMLIGLAAKNAILIVEFAKLKQEEDKLSTIDAALLSAKLRFRPILMTSFAFILGVLPLVIATGAGAASRNALGTAVFAGMLIATMFGVYTVPSLYVLIAGRKGKQ